MSRGFGKALIGSSGLPGSGAVMSKLGWTLFGYAREKLSYLGGVLPEINTLRVTNSLPQFGDFMAGMHV